MTQQIIGEREEYEALLRGYDTALLTTRGEDGHFHSRPMALQKKRESSDDLWFVTRGDSQKVHDLDTDPHCSVAFYSNQHAATYLSLSGIGLVARDRTLLRGLWEPGWKLWFPEGPESADLALIRFHPEHVEYVHPRTGRLAVLLSSVKSLVTGKRPEPAPKKELDLH